MSSSNFKVIKKSSKSQARTGKLVTSHGTVDTPAFFPVGTQGTVKTVQQKDLEDIGAQGMLCNTYHLFLRPGPELIKKAGGLHKFIGWNKPIITDSGGYQVFSIRDLKKVTDRGVEFKSHIDGKKHFFSPEKVIQVQQAFGADIIVPLDEPVPHNASKKQALRALERTTDWARKSLVANGKWQMANRKRQTLFGIVQGGTFKDLRIRSAEEIRELGFPGYCIGGLSVGEGHGTMLNMLDVQVPHLEEEKPKWLMGVGFAKDIIGAVKRGIDLFDCVLPTRIARHGSFFTMAGHKSIRNAKFRRQFKPIDTKCDCYACKNFSAAYIRHLFMAKEILAYTLLTTHNIRFMIRLMRKIREDIRKGRL